MELFSKLDADYLSGFQTLRRKINEVEADIHDYEVDYPYYLTESGWAETEYKFQTCIELLAIKNLHIERMDSEIAMMSLINDLRAVGAQAELISFATSYWNDFHNVMSMLQDLSRRLYYQVLAKLQIMYNNQIMASTSNIELAKEYTRDMSEKLSSVDKLHHRLCALLLSYGVKVERQHMEVGNEETLSLVRLPRDVTIKIKLLISLAQEIINREEKFIADVTCVMIEWRKRKRSVDQQISERRQLHLGKIKNVNLAMMLLEQNKKMIDQLDKELDELQAQMVSKETDLSQTEVEIERDENAIEFLSHAISTTKKNRRLLVKRQGLVKTRESLLKKMEQIKVDLVMFDKTRKAKSLQKEEITHSIEETQSNYSTDKEQLDAFTSSLYNIEQEAKDINTQLIDLEVLHCLKTSPENLDDLYERPQSVKLAKSLREKLTKRRHTKSIDKT